MRIGRGSLLILLGGYALLAATLTLKDNLTYRYGMYFIQDWHFGVIKRALAGEFYHLFFRAPYSIAQFQGVAQAILLAVTVLLVLLACASDAAWSVRDHGLCWGFVLTSPLAVKFLAYDYGRSDHYGLLILLLVALAHLQGRHRAATVAATVALPILALINENLLLLYGPACCFLGLAFSPGPKTRQGYLPWFALGASFILVFLLPRPSASYAEFRHYYQSISLDSLGSDNTDPFMGLREAVARTVAERRWMLRLQPEQAVSYLALVAPAFLILWRLARSVTQPPPVGARGLRLGLALVGVAYAPLFAAGTDWDRWAENLFLVGTVLLCCLAYRRRPSPPFDVPTRSLLALGIAAQAFIFRGFGVWNPLLELTNEAIFTVPAAAAVVAVVLYGLTRDTSDSPRPPATVAGALALAGGAAMVAIFLALRGPEALGGYPTTAYGCSIWAVAALAGASLFAYRALTGPAGERRANVTAAALYFLTANVAATPRLTDGIARWVVPVTLTAAEVLGLWAAARRMAAALRDGRRVAVAAAGLGVLAGMLTFPARTWQVALGWLRAAPIGTEFYFWPHRSLAQTLADLGSSSAWSLRHVLPAASPPEGTGILSLFPPLPFVLAGGVAIGAACGCLRRWPPRPAAVPWALFLAGLPVGKLIGGDGAGCLIFLTLIILLLAARAMAALADARAAGPPPQWSRALVGSALAVQLLAAAGWSLGYSLEAKGPEPTMGSAANAQLQHLWRPSGPPSAAAALSPRHYLSGQQVTVDYFGTRYQIAAPPGFVPLPGGAFYALERRYRYVKPGLEPLAIFVRPDNPTATALVVAAPRYGLTMAAADYRAATQVAVPALDAVGLPATTVPGEDTVAGARLLPDGEPVIQRAAHARTDFFARPYVESVLWAARHLVYVDLFGLDPAERDLGSTRPAGSWWANFLQGQPIAVTPARAPFAPGPPTPEDLQTWMRLGGTASSGPLEW